MKKIAHAFNDGDSVIISAEAITPAGAALPRAGKKGTIVEVMPRDRYKVDVPGFPPASVHADYLSLTSQAAQAVTAPAAAPAAPAGTGPESSWPFPINGETKQQAAARVAALGQTKKAPTKKPKAEDQPDLLAGSAASESRCTDASR